MELISMPLSGVANGSDSGLVVGLGDLFTSSYISPHAVLGVRTTRELSNRQTDLWGTRGSRLLPCSRPSSKGPTLRNGR